MTPVGFEPTISASERPQTYALDCMATGTGINFPLSQQFVQAYSMIQCDVFTSCGFCLEYLSQNKKKKKVNNLCDKAFFLTK